MATLYTPFACEKLSPVQKSVHAQMCTQISSKHADLYSFQQSEPICVQIGCPLKLMAMLPFQEQITRDRWFGNNHPITSCDRNPNFKPCLPVFFCLQLSFIPVISLWVSFTSMDSNAITYCIFQWNNTKVNTYIGILFICLFNSWTTLYRNIPEQFT